MYVHIWEMSLIQRIRMTNPDWMEEVQVESADVTCQNERYASFCHLKILWMKHILMLLMF